MQLPVDQRVSDEKRLNVAITRARYCLYIVGSSRMFKQAAEYQKLV